MIELLEGRAATPSVEPRAKPEPEERPELESERNPVLGLVVFGVSTVVAAAGGLLTWGSAAAVGDKTAAVQDRQQMQLMLWGSTVTTGLAVAGMSMGSMMVLAE